MCREKVTLPIGGQMLEIFWKKLMETWRLSITAGLRPFDKSIDGS